MQLNQTQLTPLASNMSTNDTLMIQVTYLGGGSLRDINNFEVQTNLMKIFPFIYYEADAELYLSEAETKSLEDSLIDPSVYKGQQTSRILGITAATIFLTGIIMNLLAYLIT